jgi:HK97 family phage major capsid protein
MKLKELKAQLEAARANRDSYKQKRAGATASGAAEQKSFAQIEKSVCARFGVKSISGEFKNAKEGFKGGLLHINTSDKAFRAMPIETREAVKALKEAVDVTLMCAMVLKQAPQNTRAYSELLEPSLKALGINAGETGATWIPTGVSESYVEEYNLERKVAGLFQEIKMPTNPYDFPVMTNGAVATQLGEIASKSPADTFGSSKITFRAVKLTNQYELPEELTEDSAVDVMKLIREQLIIGQEKAMEIAILEGDTGATHQHAGSYFNSAVAPSANSSERVFDGLRKRAIAAGLTVNCGGKPANESQLTLVRRKMGKYGINPAELAWISGVNVYNELMQLDDVRTLEQYGPQAPVLSGELGKYEGIPIVVSEYMREDLAATGVNTAPSDALASLLLVNRKRFMTGLRRAIQVRVEDYRIQFDVTDMVSFSRRAFQGVLLADGSNAAGAQGEKSVALLINVA